MSKSGWNRGLITLILFLFLITPCEAQVDLLSYVTLKQYPSGSFRVKYGGIRGYVDNQITSHFHTIHREWVEIAFADDPIAAREELRQMAYAQADIDNGGAWFKRRWWESLPESAGGAPTRPISVYRGPTGNFIDLGLAYVTSDFEFKWREYEVNLTETLTPSSFGFTSPHKWNFRIRPEVKFSARTIWRSASISCVFEYSHYNRKLINIALYANYSLRLKGFQIGISISLLQW